MNRNNLLWTMVAILLFAGFCLGRWSARGTVEKAYQRGAIAGAQAAWKNIEASRASLIEVRDRFHEEVRKSMRHQVVKIVDGDTLDIKAPSGIVTRIRLSGFDAPERGEPGFEQAAEALATLTEGKWVTVLPREEDHYPPTVAPVFVEGGPELSALMLEEFPQWKVPPK